MAIALIPQETDTFRIVQAIRQIIQGRSDAVLEVTLTPGATTTVVPWINCSTESKVFLSPKTANAAAAIPTTYVSAVVQGGFTLTHANNAQADKVFMILVNGG